MLGIAYKADGGVAAKFSDTANLEFAEKKELEEFTKHPYHYENQFDIAAGSYTLKVAFTSGAQSFGKLESRLVIAPYDKKQFAISSLALSRRMYKVSDITSGLESELLEDRKPLVYQGLQLIPTGSNHFTKTEPMGAYLEVYDPFLLADNPPKLALEIHVLDRASGKDEIHAAITNTAEAIKPGSPVVPMALHIPVEKLNPGAYRLDLQAIDAAGHISAVSSAEFELQ